ncbi:MAG: hypothetical protein O6940_04940 [Ignavibacteria bacterium]|nr:hypothetical protein [Ignavibacteria bacterium]
MTESFNQKSRLSGNPPSLKLPVGKQGYGGQVLMKKYYSIINQCGEL